MEDRNEAKKYSDEVMLPGFRFHPTDEELVGFYLRRKIQQKPLSIELIKQLDIYKHDPWDLPKLATTGEKEWYFYCPRDRKYRNSARPNRVTGAGFWKATGTDRPIYSSEGSKCIGLKKSLVFYKGRAAKGIKTDWMMHEFRLPSVEPVSNKRYLDKNIPANEAWAICRIFKKANSNANRALSHSWASPVFETTTTSDMTNPYSVTNIQFSSSNATSSNKITNMPLQYGFFNNYPEQSSITSFYPMNFPSCKQVYQMENKPCQVSVSNGDHLTSSYTMSSNETSKPVSKCVINDASSLLLDMSSTIFGDFGKGPDNVEQISTSNGFSASLTGEIQGNLGQAGEQMVLLKDQNVGEFDDQWGTMKSMGLSYGFPLSLPHDAWKSLVWDSSPCPSELSTSYSTNKCYT